MSKTVQQVIKEIEGDFKGIHRGTLTANTALTVDFLSPPSEFLIQNLSESGNLYLALTGAAEVDGQDTIKVPAGIEISGIKSNQIISIISDSAIDYQIIGVK